MGSFREKNGKLEYRFSFKDPYGKVIRKSVTGYSEEECLGKYEAFMKSVASPVSEKSDGTTIPMLLKEVLNNDFNKNYIQESTYSLYLGILEIIESGSLKTTPITDVTGDSLEQFLVSLAERYSDSVVKKVYSQLNIAMSTAVERDIIKDNPMSASNFTRPKSGKKPKKVDAFTVEEQKKFIAILEEYKVPRGRNNYKNQILIELYSGLRMGEINALTPECIDFKNNVIHVRSTISHGIENRAYVKDGAKTYEGSRDVPISRKLKPVLEQALEQMSDNQLGFIFYDCNKDDVISTKQVNSFFRRVIDKAGIPARGQHALRHTFATRCIEAGVSAEVLRKWLGHKNIHMTLDTYAVVFSSLHNKSIERFETGLKVKESLFKYMAA